MIWNLLLCLLLLPSLACAGQGMGPGPGFKTYATSGTYYYSTGSDSYPNTDITLSTGEAMNSITTAGATGSLTKIGVKVTTKGTANLKVIVFNQSSAIHECFTVTNAAMIVGWNELTLATPLAVTSGNTIGIAVASSAANQTYFTYAAGSSGLLGTASASYSTFCTDSETYSDLGAGPLGVRIYVQ